MPTWTQIRSRFSCPQWFADARLGIWVHWGPQSQPRLGGGWYARHMYMADVGAQEWGRNAYDYHQRTYGHQSVKGYKDVIHAWRAEHLDTDALLDYFSWVGARYFVAMANHHDHFDNFDSSLQPWNSVNVGPHRDLIGDFAASSRRVGIPFGVSSHDDRMLMYYEHAFDADADGPRAGVPYDGNLTLADGVGTWWEGLDPADLYGPPPARRTDAWVEQMKATWELRHKELIERYRPDLLWFDGYGFPYGEHGREVCRAFYARRLAEVGQIDNVVVGKIADEPAVIDDIEKGVALRIRPDVWQSTLTCTGWFYKEDVPSRHNGRTMIEVLTDVISKNGNLLVNVELLGDGTIPDEHKAYLDDLGTWVNINAAAIFGSRPWHIHGDNLATANHARRAQEADDQGLGAGSEQFNERTVDDPPYPHDEVRFTTNHGRLYVFVLNPASGPLRLPALGRAAAAADRIESVQLLGSDASIAFRQDDDAVVIDVPSDRPTAHVTVFEVTWMDA